MLGHLSSLDVKHHYKIFHHRRSFLEAFFSYSWEFFFFRCRINNSLETHLYRNTYVREARLRLASFPLCAISFTNPSWFQIGRYNGCVQSYSSASIDVGSLKLSFHTSGNSFRLGVVSTRRWRRIFVGKVTCMKQDSISRLRESCRLTGYRLFGKAISIRSSWSATTSAPLLTKESKRVK